MANKQDLKVQPKPNTNLFEIKSTVADIPNSLKGSFTSQREALLAINRFRTINYKRVLPRQQGKKKIPPKIVKEAIAKINEGKLDGTTGKYKASQ